MSKFHLHLIDGSELNDHRSIDDIDVEDWSQAIKRAKAFFAADTQDKLLVEEIGEITLVQYPDDKFDKGFEYAVEVEKID